MIWPIWTTSNTFSELQSLRITLFPCPFSTLSNQSAPFPPFSPRAVRGWRWWHDTRTIDLHRSRAWREKRSCAAVTGTRFLLYIYIYTWTILSGCPVWKPIVQPGHPDRMVQVYIHEDSRTIRPIHVTLPVPWRVKEVGCACSKRTKHEGFCSETGRLV